jgi:hypothetical protein
MLAWTQHADGWHADGYLIRLAAPFRWVLVPEDDASTDAVSAVAEPLATTRTLTEAKREAELLATAVHRSERRRNWAAQALTGICAIVFAVGLPMPWAFIVTVALGIFALRCLALILGSALAATNYSHTDFFYQ